MELLLKDLHVKYVASLDSDAKKETFEYHITQHLKLNGIYWGLVAVSLLGEPDALDKEGVVAFIKSCQHPNGGFGGNVDHDPHLIYTLSAVQVLAMYDRLDAVDTGKIVEFVQSLQKEDGSFAGDKWSEIDTRFSYIALSILSLLHKLDAVDVERAVQFILSCRNFDGGFGSVPGAESHAGQVFCCVGALAIVDQVHHIDQELLAWWISERQVPGGGLNGRPEKKEDVCYSWWCMSAMSILNRLHWINKDKLVKFILSCQDDEDGGIADRAGDVADVYHTCFGIAGLSLLNYEGLDKVNPIYCMPQSTIDRLKLGRYFLSSAAS